MFLEHNSVKYSVLFRILKAKIPSVYFLIFFWGGKRPFFLYDATPLLTGLLSQLIDIKIFFRIRVKNYIAKKLDVTHSNLEEISLSHLGSRPGSYRQVFTVNVKEKKI